MSAPTTTDDKRAPSAGAQERLSLRILLVEDDRLDAQLALEALEEDGIEGERRVVDDRDGFLAALSELQPDIVLSDVSLPGFSGHEALRLLRERDRHLPFVFLSGTIGEDTAIEALRAGATDYILKSRNARLAVAVRRAIAEAEERRARDTAEAELIRSQRFQTLAILAGSLSHDLRNTLQPVLMATAMIEHRDQDPDVGRYCATIRDCLQQSLALVQAMMDLASGASSDAHNGRVRIGALLDAAMLLARPSLHRDVTLDMANVDPALEIPGDAMELQQCVLNLLLNAIQSIDGSGTVRIDAMPVKLPVDFLRDGEERIGDDYVRVRIRDTGRGMDAATLGRLFTPFFTTRKGGTGLGLISCKRFLERHHGLIRVSSELGKGSSFDIYLPVQARESQDASAGAAHAAAPGRHEYVAVVPGNEADGRQLVDILDLYDYRPVPAQQLGEVAAADPDLRLVLAAHGLLEGQGLSRLRSAGYQGPVLSYGSRDDTAIAGVAGHLATPFTAPVVLRALADALPPRPTS